MSAPLMKAGYFDCPGILEWARRQRCVGCDGPPRVTPQHYPTKGAGGDDLSVIPACLKCHGKMQRYEKPYTREWQHVQALVSLSRFVRTANATEWASFVTARERWAESRVFMEAF